MLGLEKVRNPVERVIIDQDGAQKALLRLDIMGSAAESGGSRIGSEFQNVRIKRGHVGLVFSKVWQMRGADKAPLLREAEAATGLMHDSHNRVWEIGKVCRRDA
jgi:hypothetical protein